MKIVRWIDVRVNLEMVMSWTVIHDVSIDFYFGVADSEANELTTRFDFDSVAETIKALHMIDEFVDDPDQEFLDLDAKLEYF